MIKQHFQNELAKCGYPNDLTIEYSLGYFQGDGVAFFGDLGVDDVKALMKRLFSTVPGQVDAGSCVKNQMVQKDIEGMLFFLSEYGSCDLSITRNSHWNHSCDWSCMKIDDNVDFTGNESWQDLWKRFVSKLADDVKIISQKMESDAYRIADTSLPTEKVIWKKATKNYLARITELPMQSFDEWDYELACKGEKLELETIQSILEGTVRVSGLRAEILSREDEIILGEEHLFNLLITNGDRTYAGYKRVLLREAITKLSCIIKAGA